MTDGIKSFARAFERFQSHGVHGWMPRHFRRSYTDCRARSFAAAWVGSVCPSRCLPHLQLRAGAKPGGGICRVSQLRVSTGWVTAGRDRRYVWKFVGRNEASRHSHHSSNHRLCIVRSSGGDPSRRGPDTWCRVFYAPRRRCVVLCLSARQIAEKICGSEQGRSLRPRWPYCRGRVPLLAWSMIRLARTS